MNSDGGDFIRGFSFNFSLLIFLFYLISLLISPASL